MSKTKERKPSASERIEGLERKVLAQDAQIEKLAEILDEVDRKFIALAKRVNASITASSTNETVDSIIQEENAKELKKMVDTLVEMGGLVANNDGEIVEQSFVVGRHISAEGNEITPRLQFYNGSLVEEERVKFLGKKVGDMIESDDKSVSIEITEIYETVTPDVEQEYDEVEAEVEAEIEAVADTPQEESESE